MPGQFAKSAGIGDWPLPGLFVWLQFVIGLGALSRRVLPLTMGTVNPVITCLGHSCLHLFEQTPAQSSKSG